MIKQHTLIKAHKYLKHMNKDFLKIKTFIDGMKQVLGNKC